MSEGSTGLTGQTGSTGSELPEMIFSDDHLPYFDVVNRALGLQGEKYQPYRKACYYSLISAPVRKVKVCQGDVEEDLRTHYAFFLPSGGGKKAIVNLFNDVLDEFDISKPTSFHPAQLVGKTKNEEGEAEQIPGHLDAEIFIKDEGYKIFTEESDNYQKVRSHLNEATDTYGRNGVQKKNVDTHNEDRLTYFPDTNINILSQPFNISEKSVQEGLMRRFDLPYSRFKVKKRTELYRLRANPSSDLSREKAISILQDYLEELEDFYSDISTLELTKEATRYYLGFHDYMVTYGFSHSDNGSFYTNMVDFSLMDKFLKYAALQAVSRKRTKIKSQDVFRAFIDLTEFFSCKMEFLKDHLKGDISYEGDITLAQDSLEMRVLEYLSSQGATSKEKSDVSISEFKQLIVNYGDYKNKNSARRPYDKLKEQGYIDTKTESNKSFVWLEKDIEDLKSPVNQYREELAQMNYYEEANKRLGHLLNPFSPLCLTEVSTNLGFKEFWDGLESNKKAQKTAKKHLSSGGLS